MSVLPVYSAGLSTPSVITCGMSNVCWHGSSFRMSWSSVGLDWPYSMELFYNFDEGAASTYLVSTYVVCERLSVMHEPAGVVEILVQILHNTPILKYSFRIPPPPKMKIVKDLGTLTFQFQNTPPPPKLKFRQILAL